MPGRSSTPIRQRPTPRAPRVRSRSLALRPVVTSARFQQPGELQARPDLQLAVERGHVVLARPLADREERGDLLIRLSIGDMGRDLELARAQDGAFRSLLLSPLEPGNVP